MPPYVLPADLPYVLEFNQLAKRNVRIHTNLLPEPCFGRLNAPVVVLLLNPHVGKKDARHHKQGKFAYLLREELAQQTPVSHFHLVDETKGPGRDWWSSACRELIADTDDLDTVAENLLSVEFFPYHSKSFAQSYLRLPSQEYSFWLVRKAIARSAYIVCMRGRRIWTSAIPELGRYGRLIEPNSNRCRSLSKGNLPEYETLVEELERSQRKREQKS